MTATDGRLPVADGGAGPRDARGSDGRSPAGDADRTRAGPAAEAPAPDAHPTITRGRSPRRPGTGASAADGDAGPPARPSPVPRSGGDASDDDASDVTSEVAPAAQAPTATPGPAVASGSVATDADGASGTGPAPGEDADTDEAARSAYDAWAGRGERASAARTGRAQALRERYGTGPVPDEPGPGAPAVVTPAGDPSGTELAAVPPQPGRTAPPGDPRPPSSPTGRPGDRPGPGRRGGRHARTEDRSDDPHTPPHGYRPRHAAPDAETEQLARADIAAAEDEAAASAAPAGRPGGPHLTAVPTPVTGLPLRSVTLGDGDMRAVDPAGPDRVRVVLAERRSPTRAVRTVAEIEQQTETGEFLLSNLMRAQLSLGVRLGLVAAIVLGALPVLFLVLPRLGDVAVLGVLRVPWLVLGLAPYPFFALLGWLYTHHAERNERDFAENVED